MTRKEIWNKAYKRLFDLYGDMPDLRIVSRFYSEKMILQESDYIRYLDLFGRISERATALGEHIRISGTAGSSFIAYLLGATDINPLPFHEYCPKCKHVRFTEKSMALDRYFTKCNCGSDMMWDGNDLPFEMSLQSVFQEYIQLSVSQLFFKEAETMIYEYMSDRAIVTLKGDDDISLTLLCFLKKDKNTDTVYPLKDSAALFQSTPHITLAPTPMLDKYRELEVATGVKMVNVPYDIGAISEFFKGSLGRDFYSIINDPEVTAQYNVSNSRFANQHRKSITSATMVKIFIRFLCNIAVIRMK